VVLHAPPQDFDAIELWRIWCQILNGHIFPFPSLLGFVHGIAMMTGRVIDENMQGFRVFGAMPDVAVGRCDDTIIIDRVLKDERLEVIIYAKEAKDIQAFVVVLGFEAYRSFRMLPCHWLRCMEAEACRIGICEVNLSTSFASFEIRDMLLAPLVVLGVRCFCRTFDNPFKAVSGFAETAANTLEAQRNLFFLAPPPPR
jgi:hypothetical protein